MSKPKNLIYFVYSGEETFNDEEHLHNYIKYLFSCSNSHTENENTKNNFYLSLNKTTGALNTCSFVYDSHDKYSKFTKKFSLELNDCRKLKNDLFYVVFMLHFNGKIISNIFKYLEEDNSLTYVLPKEALGVVINEHFDCEEDFEDLLENNLSSTNNEYFHLDDVSSEERIIIEKLVHLELIKNSKYYPEGTVLLSISHHDQESMYHIHRLIKH